MRRYPLLLLLAGLGAGLLAGCGPPPGIGPTLEQARVSYAKVAGDSLITAQAPLAVARADSQLREAERQWGELGNPAAAEHHAYLAVRYSETAEQQTRLWSARQELEQAETERKQALLTLSQQQTEQAQGEAALARRQAEQARQRALILANRVRDLEARETERGLVLTLSDVLFASDKVKLMAGGEQAVDQLVTFLKEYPRRNVLIEGHTDNTGTEAYNLDLSKRRAEAVQVAMTNRGIALRRIRTMGYGEAYPVASNDTAAGRQQNRRVEVVLSDAQGHITER